MTAKQITDIAESLEKLGYEIIKIKEKKKTPDFPYSPASMKIIITPLHSLPDKIKKEFSEKPNSFLNTFNAATKNN